MPAPPKQHATYALQAATLQRIARQIASDPDPARAELRLLVHEGINKVVEAINEDTARVLRAQGGAAPPSPPKLNRVK